MSHTHQVVSTSYSCKLKNEWDCTSPLVWHPNIDTKSFTLFIRLFAAKDIQKQLLEQILGIPQCVVINSLVCFCINCIKINLNILNYGI